MDYEKKYKDALVDMQELYNSMKYMSSTDALHTTTTLEKAFPELKESEDEKIRKVITLIIKGIRANVFEEKGISKKDTIDWLEKQGEKKPTWSKDDDSKIESICRLLKARFDKDTCDEVGFTRDKMCDYLIGLKNKIKPQWKPSEEQIHALEYQVNSTYIGSWQYKASKELLEQFKKL